MNPCPAIPTAKEALRAAMRLRLNALPHDALESGSRKIRQRLFAAEDWHRAAHVLGFVPLPREPDILPILTEAAAAGRWIALLRWNAKRSEYEAARFRPDGHLISGPYGVLEPPADAPTVAFEQLDLVMVPGLAFDRNGRRLGRGKGFFDRILTQAARACRWGIAFDQQLVTDVPSALHDVPMDLIATPGHWLPMTRSRVT